MSFQLENMRLAWQGDKAIRVVESGIARDDEEDGVNSFLLPRSQIEGCDMENVGEVGCVEITDWLARKLELEEEDE